ncbi:MAG: GntR family transcriptional regulator [Gemmatimonadales bacterium]|jgi:DNA-binding GntR family transcriptional regulator
MTIATVDRSSIADQLEKLLLDRILDGSLPAGDRLNESRLAEEMGASRTPLREALSRLHRAGLVVSRPHHGFFVADLSAGEARELYECLALLESSALQLAGIPGVEQLAELERINRRLDAAADGAEGIALNTEWHRALLAGCPNAHLLEIVEGVRTKVRRYEFAFFAPGPERIATSVRLHRRILTALAAGDMATALRGIVDHWFTDLDELAPRASDGGTAGPRLDT